MCDSETAPRLTPRELVKKIQDEHGQVSEEILNRLEEVGLLEAMTNALNAKDKLIGSSVITLAKNLYTSNARFVFELLQNADDATYKKTDDSPFISFHIHPRKIVVEYNEDGFTAENLSAICNVGQSTKKGADGYIGEKGIGFKSVFMVAWKVLIQSGEYSFYFQHRIDDPGMGMISPIWHEPEDAVTEPLTRMTLYLHNSGDAAFLANQRQLILSQFHELQNTFLLFLKNIKKISLKFYDDDHTTTKEILHSLEKNSQGNAENLTKEIITPGNIESHSRSYHVMRHVATGLEKNENRVYSEEEELQKKYSKSEVVLAFPLTPDSTPLVEDQEVFAFLPLRSAGFSFLIQADFVTEANRQDVIAASPRNLGLLCGVAQAFIKAVLEFCENPTLTYQWMRYLPNHAKLSSRPFWKQLINQIQSLLDSTPVLRSRSEGPLRLVKSLRRSAVQSLDNAGEPLWDDIDPPCYLSPLYHWSDVQILTSYGLQNIFWFELVARAKSDLGSPYSKMKTSSDESWHSCAARSLTYLFTHGTQTAQSRLRELCLIPLQNGQWISANDGPVYYASCAGEEIPRDLGMNLIDQTAAENPERKILFDHLGASEASTDHVRNMILSRYNFRPNQVPVGLQASRDHLKYLYLTQKSADDFMPGTFSKVYVYTQEEQIQYANQTAVYMIDSNEYGTRELLKRTPPGPNPGNGAPGLSVCFLHSVYLEDAPDRPAEQPLNWTTFLSRYVNIQGRPSLVSNSTQNPASLSDITRYLQRHRPEIFLRTIQYYSNNELRKIVAEIFAVIEMCSMKVLCRGGRMIPLSQTYLPTPSLERLQARYMVDSEFFPFLSLLFPPVDDAQSDKWEILHKHFMVGRYDDLDFYLTILTSILDANESAQAIVSRPRVYGVYGCIQTKLLPSDHQIRQKSMIRELFEKRSAILIPESPGRRSAWVRPSQCLWDGPQDMQTKYPVKSLCQAYFTASESGRSSLEEFFRKTLRLPDCSWSHLVEEIKHLKATSCTDFDRINDLYSFIDKAIRGSDVDDIERLRQEIEANDLIYVNANGRHNWHKISQCLWASVTAIRGRTTLNDHYEGLKDFFVTVLGVSELNLDMMVDELIEKGARETSVVEIKRTLWALTSFLSSNTPVSSRRILESRIFPVRDPNGQLTLQTSGTEFGIVDRQRLGDSFAGKASLLDFSLEEVRELKPFFAWTGLEKRYLSNLVKEISSIDGSGSRLVASRSRDLCRKAPGLFRIAAHYSSPRVSENKSSLKDSLDRGRVYETDGISSLLILSQGGHEVTVEIEKSELHIREDASGLQIYVPSDPRSQECCFLSKLPPRLFEWMMTESDTQIREAVDPEAVLIVTKILNAQLSSVNWILEDAGIIVVAGAEFIDDHEQSDREADGVAEEVQRVNSFGSTTLGGDSPGREGILTPATSEIASSISTQDPGTSTTLVMSAQSSNSRSVLEVVESHARHRPEFSGLLQPLRQRIEGGEMALTHTEMPPQPEPVSGVIDSVVDEETQYLALLDNMIDKARATSIPTLGSFSMSQLLQSLPEVEQSPEVYSRRSAKQQDRDFKVGAAGELFVFELLSHLDPKLPGFDEKNWESTVRKYVRVHPQYAPMKDWNGRETADITYEDSSGVLTQLLIEEGYLAPDPWLTRRPKYYIEVKSTTGHCGSRFFVSKSQRQLMQRLAATEQDAPPRDAIYIVFRVFDVGMGTPGVRLYVDPERMSRTGALQFTTETWSVVPGQAGT